VATAKAVLSAAEACMIERELSKSREAKAAIILAQAQAHSSSDICAAKMAELEGTVHQLKARVASLEERLTQSGMDVDQDM
jgi:uncharacterized protein YceH (UPF0502 family)